ncbi:hypothetical protein Sjap_024750 [Stephania japonica]|uniref:Uncharacterized protein n=1 Tax=Stephania japonica TaxID=461633 RepID=A0AAP0HK55_9MAGN
MMSQFQWHLMTQVVGNNSLLQPTASIEPFIHSIPPKAAALNRPIRISVGLKPHNPTKPAPPNPARHRNPPVEAHPSQRQRFEVRRGKERRGESVGGVGRCAGGRTF